MEYNDGLILLVEDNKVDEDLTLRAFKKNNLKNEIKVVRDGEEVLRFLFGTDQYAGRDLGVLPHLILLDLKLPKIDGLDVLRRIRSDPRTRLLPVVMLTSSKEEQDLIESYRLGANSYVRKPVDFNEFVAAVTQLGLYWLALNRLAPAPGSSAVREKLRVLILEDSEDDALLLVRKLSKEGNYETFHLRVDSLAALKAALEKQEWDIVISDHSMPQFTAISALDELHKRGLDIPVIILSGAIEPSAAVAAMKAGASDYIMKGDMTRLLPAIERELRESRSRRERRLADKNLEERNVEMIREQEKFQQISQAIEEVFWMTNPDSTEMIYISPAYEKIWGRTCESLYNAPREWTEAMHPEDRERAARTASEQMLAGGESEFRILRPDGELRWIKNQIFPIKDATGKIHRVAGVAADITKTKQFQAQFHKAQKMEAIGRLAGGVAHDFNNLLTAIGGYSHFLLNSLAADDKRREDVEQIKKAGETAAGLTRQLLAFSRQQVLQMKVVDCNFLVSDLEKMLRRIVSEDVKLTTVLSPEPGFIKSDPGQIEQVLLNLVVNAKDALPKGGSITIETSNVELKGDYARMHLQVKPGSYVMFAVSDSGTGMESETLTHLFEPFFTTKEQGKGTGLGLATVYGIVKQSGGGIYVQSEIGAGTIFKVYFPRVAEASQPADVGRVPEKSPHGSETILLVEDDERVRTFVYRALLECGYAVLAAQDSAQAMRLCEKKGDSVNLILTDVIMPQMHGPELVKLLLPLCPGAKVIFMSGYTDTVVTHRGLIDSGAPFLQKPLTPDALARKVREVLDGAR
jgi:two-component system cell cycle sensor histidine kinase/response regulator CckA